MYKTVVIDGTLHKELKIEAIRKGISLTELISKKLGQKNISELPTAKELTKASLETIKPFYEKNQSFVKQRGEINSEDYV